MMFSIATPTRNCLEKVQRCVGSIRGQRPVEYEHLVQDATSTDGTAEWLLGQKDIQAVSERDAGMYDAINRAWLRSRGQYLSWLNADEQYLPGTLARVQQAFSDNPEVDVVWGNAIVADAEGNALALRREIRVSKLYIANSFLNAQSCTIFFRRRLFEEGLLTFDSKYRYAGDMDLVLRLVSSGKKFLHLPVYLSIFGVDGSNLSVHPGMRTETTELQRKYGGYTSKLLRGGVRLGRWAERMLQGCYWPRSYAYDFALDDRPAYKRFYAHRVGGRYSIPDNSGNE